MNPHIEAIFSAILSAIAVFMIEEHMMEREINDLQRVHEFTVSALLETHHGDCGE